MMKNAILQKGFANVILVDWSDSNQPPYFQAIANGRVVGAQIARLINALQVRRRSSYLWLTRFHCKNGTVRLHAFLPFDILNVGSGFFLYLT